jgi:hypothetical protein
MAQTAPHWTCNHEPWPDQMPATLFRPHPSLVVSERFKPGVCPALVEPPGIFDRMGAERPVGDGELGAVELGLPGIDPDSVLEVSQVRGGSFPLGDCRAQGRQERPLLDRIVVRVLGEEPRCLGCLLPDECAPRPSPAGEQLSKPPGVVRIGVLPLLDEVVRQPAGVWIAPRRGQVTDPLILLTPVEQLAPELFIH